MKPKFLSCGAQLALLAGIWLAPAAQAEDKGWLEYNLRDRDRLHQDVDSLETRFSSRRVKLFLQQDLNENFSYTVLGEAEDWTLTGLDGKKYVSLGFPKFIPKVIYETERIRLFLALVMVGVQQRDALYQQVDAEGRKNFTLPSFSARYKLGAAFVELNSWGELDVQTMDYLRYYPVAHSTLRVGGGYHFNPQQMVRLDLGRTERFYPANFPLDRQDVELTYQHQTPWGLDWWRVLEAGYYTQRYTESARDNTKANLFNSFAFEALGQKHFVDYRLTQVSTVTVYTQGGAGGTADEQRYAIIENYLEKPDLEQEIAYSTFWRLGQSQFYFTFKAAAMDSLKVGAFTDRQVWLQLSYAFGGDGQQPPAPSQPENGRQAEPEPPAEAAPSGGAR